MFEIVLPLVFMALILSVISPERDMRLAAIVGDEDMKIAPGGFSPSAATDTHEAEEDAKAYMTQKNSGNVGKARTLGEKYAETLGKVFSELNAEGQNNSSHPLRTHHKTVLFSYVVNRVIANLSPNSILAHTTLNVFYDELEQKSPEISAHLQDMAAFSLYILCERSDSCSELEMGAIYARLCGAEDNKELVGEGKRLYREYSDICVGLHEQTSYVTV